MLSVNEISVHYDGVTALRNVSLQVNEGEIVAIIGANGAGKSTLLRSIANLVLPSAGSIEYAGHRLNDLGTEKIVGLGISLVPETRELFPDMSCRDNLRAGLFSKKASGSFDDHVQPIFKLFPRLEERLNQRAGTLSGGEQQMLAIGRALMQDPTLLLLDEPSLGLSPNLTEMLFSKISDIRASGRTVVLVEQKGRLALDIADRVYVLTVGEVALEGTPSDLRRHSSIKRVYFGG